MFYRTAVVECLHLDGLLLVELLHYGESPVAPLQLVAVDECAPCYRRENLVAVLVAHAVHRELHDSLLYALVRLLQIDDERVVVHYEVVEQLALRSLCLDGCRGLGLDIAAYRNCVRHLLRRVSLLLLVFQRELQFLHALPFDVCLKRIVSQESLLSAVKTVAVAVLHERFALVEIPYTHLVNLALEEVVCLLLLQVVGRSPHTSAEMYVSRSYATKVGCLEVSVQLAVHVYLSASACTVDSYSYVVPVVVGVATVARHTHTVVVEHQTAFLQIESEEIERTAHVLAVAASVRDDGSRRLSLVGLEPCLDGVVHAVVYDT